MPSRNVQVITRTRRKRRKSVTELGSGVESAMLSTEITRKEFARICSRERSKLLVGGEGRGAIGPRRNRIEIRRIDRSFRLSTFSFDSIRRFAPVTLSPAPLSYICRSGRDKRMDDGRLCARETDLRGVFVHARKT